MEYINNYIYQNAHMNQFFENMGKSNIKKDINVENFNQIIYDN